jgi:hypothetical protein
VNLDSIDPATAYEVQSFDQLAEIASQPSDGASFPVNSEYDRAPVRIAGECGMRFRNA